jgi:hypothetical protein
MSLAFRSPKAWKPRSTDYESKRGESMRRDLLKALRAARDHARRTRDGAEEATQSARESEQPGQKRGDYTAITDQAIERAVRRLDEER